eukprot:scaffold309729_cov14-Tisochrysis_lutea.AAC.1
MEQRILFEMSSGRGLLRSKGQPKELFSCRNFNLALWQRSLLSNVLPYPKAIPRDARPALSLSREGRPRKLPVVLLLQG